MSEYSLTTMFVVPTANALPTTGTNASLTAGQFGLFLPDYTPATVGNVGGVKYVQFSQGRNVYAPGEGTKNSDYIYQSNIMKKDGWYKVTGSLVQNTQITEISNLSAGCNENISVTLRLNSMYISAAYNNGLTRSVMVTTPCCNCGTNPCDTLSADDIQATMQALAQAINDDDILTQYVIAGTQGSGATTKIIIQARTLQEYGQGTSTDLTNFPYQFDRMYFWTFVMSGPELTTDYEVIDRCNDVADVAILQRASYPINTPAEIAQLEKDYFSYQAEYKEIFSNVNYNGEFTTYVDSASAYDLYYLKFKREDNINWVANQSLDETVVIALPQNATNYAAIVALLTAAFGTAVNESTTPTTSSSFTTSSTTSTTSTVSPTP